MSLFSLFLSLEVDLGLGSRSITMNGMRSSTRQGGGGSGEQDGSKEPRVVERSITANPLLLRQRENLGHVASLFLKKKRRGRK
jgi:hypothetical protein